MHAPRRVSISTLLTVDNIPSTLMVHTKININSGVHLEENPRDPRDGSQLLSPIPLFLLRSHSDCTVRNEFDKSNTNRMGFPNNSLIFYCLCCMARYPYRRYLRARPCSAAIASGGIHICHRGRQKNSSTSTSKP